MLVGDLIAAIFYLSISLLIIFFSTKVIDSRNKGKQKWKELDHKIDQIKKTIAEEVD